MTAAAVMDRAGLDVSRETIERLEIFASLVLKWTHRINLVSTNSLDHLWSRHILDSCQVFTVAPVARSWIDLGSGGGFPGIVAAILATELQPDLSVTLVDSDKRKATFLRTAARETGIAINVIADRIEHCAPAGAEVVSARAVTSLVRLLGMTERHLLAGGTALFPKGETWRSEVDVARQTWRFDLEPITSLTEPRAAILRIKGAIRA
jgi:16S rRNA (guanine527-N7)-methyltransferase